MCRPSANTENSNRMWENPLVPRVRHSQHHRKLHPFGPPPSRNFRYGYFLEQHIPSRKAWNSYIEYAGQSHSSIIASTIVIKMEYTKNHFMLNAGKMNEHLFITVTVYLPFSFRKKKKKDSQQASTKISYQFLGPEVPVSGRNKASNSNTSTDPFSATKTLVLGNLFKTVRFAITFARAVCHWG